jgi:hypothetical protein
MIMRFLIFNAVVVAALFYLFNADRDDIASAADTAHSVIARAQDAASSAVDRARDISETHRLQERLDEFSRRMGDVVPADETKTLPQDRPVPKVSENLETPRPPLPPEPEESGTKAPETGTRLAQADAAEPTIPERWIPERPNYTVDHEAAETAIPEVPTEDPAVAKRRAEVLGNSEETRPSRRNSEIAIAEGESLMTPRERRKELHNLAEDMELVFIKKLGR